MTVACSVFIVTDVLYEGAASLGAAATAAAPSWCWFGLGVLWHRRDVG